MAKEKNNIKQESKQEKADIKLQILESMSTLATAGFGLVAALAWNEAIKDLFSVIFPAPGGSVLAKFIYALFITILIVIVTMQIGRALNLAKKTIKKDK
ncbi:MAG: hypothetical protein HY979_02020 [Candidatus Magasanikbacteria bacterium]|nr:hypothetical protein [Candidatus Magasanikbacteria bacterium]